MHLILILIIVQWAVTCATHSGCPWFKSKTAISRFIVAKLVCMFHESSLDFLSSWKRLGPGGGGYEGILIQR